MAEVRVNAGENKAKPALRSVPSSASVASWDEFESLFCQPELRSLLGDFAYPTNDADLSTVPKKSRYQTPPSLPDSELTTKYMKNIAHYFSQDYCYLTLCKRNQEKPKQTTESEFADRVNSLDPDDKKKATQISLATIPAPKDFAIPGKFKCQELDRVLLTRAANLPEPQPVHLKLRPHCIDALAPDPNLDFKLTVTQLSFQFGTVEPLFASLSLWDASTGTKITEDFTFQMNSKETMKLIGGVEMDPIWAGNQATLSIDFNLRNSKLYLLCLVSRVLVGDLEMCYDVYSKGKEVKEKDRTKYVTENSEMIRHLQKFRQPFAWSAVSLFKDDGSLISPNFDIKIDNFTRIKTDIASFLEESFKADRKEKDRKAQILGHCLLSFKPITPLDPTIENRLTSSLWVVEPFVGTKPDRIREIASFARPEAPQICTEPVNNLYFYPGKLNIDGLSSAGSARNICMEIKVLQSDLNPEDSGLPWIYGSSGFSTTPSRTPFVTSTRTPVWYHQKKPRFMDEIKIMLPFNLPPKLHILITLSHVNCKLGKPSKSSSSGSSSSGDGPDQPFAYAAICLSKQSSGSGHRSLISGSYSAHVVSKSSMTSKYLDGDLFKEDSDTSGRGSLDFSFNIISSIHSVDSSVDHFLSKAGGLEGKGFADDAVKCLEEFEKANCDRKEIVRFLPLLLTTLLGMVGHEAQNVRSKAFTVLLNVMVQAVETAPSTVPQFLQSYIDLLFDEIANSTSYPIYMQLLISWAGANGQLSPTRDVCFRYAWFLSGIVIKSLCITFQKTGGILGKGRPDENRTKRFQKPLYDALVDLYNSAAVATRQYHVVDTLTTTVAHRFTVHLANFTADLYGIIDRGQLNRIVLSYMEKLASFSDPLNVNSALSFDHVATRCLFFKVLEQHPHYYIWNLPQSQDFKTGIEMVKLWASRHILSSAFLDTFKASYHGQCSPQTRELLLDTFIGMICHVDNNEQFDDPDGFSESSNLYAQSDTPRSNDQIVGLPSTPNSKNSSTPTVLSPRTPRIGGKAQAPTSSSLNSLQTQTLSSRSRIAALYMPYVFHLIDKFDLISIVSVHEKKKALLPLAWLLKHAPPALWVIYWERDSEKRIFTLFKYFTMMMNVFELKSESDICMDREKLPFPNPFFYLQDVDVSVLMALLNAQGTVRSASSSDLPSIGTSTLQRNSKAAELAAAAAQDNDLSFNDADHLGLLASGMRTIAVPTVKSKKRKGSDAPPYNPSASSSTPTSNAPSNNTATNLAPTGSLSPPVKSDNASGGSLKVRQLSTPPPAHQHTPSSSSGGNSNTGTLRGHMHARWTIGLEVKRELNFSRELTLVMLDSLVLFANYFPKAMKRRETFELIWLPLLTLGSRNQTVDAALSIIEVCYHLLPAFKVHFFSKRNSACPELLTLALRYCNSESSLIRNHAVTLLIRIILSNFVAVGNIDRSRLQATIAIIKIVGQSHATDFSKLTSALSFATQEIVKADGKSLLPSSSSNNLSISISSAKGESSAGTLRSGSGFFNSQNTDAARQLMAKALKDVENKVSTIIADNKKMHEYEFDPDMLTDLYYNMSLHLQDSPDERITWLENLAEHHREHKNLEECAQAKVITAALVQMYLKSLGRWETNMVPAFHLVAPNMTEETTQTSIDLSSLSSLKDEVCQSSTFTQEGFSLLLSQAINLLKEGGFYESCATAYRMILPIYYEEDNYSKQKECYAELQWLCQQILDENVMKQRIFSNYYRVVAYGPKLGPDLNGVEYIYKEGPAVRLIDFTEKIKSQYLSKFGDSNVVLLPNSQVVKPAELNQQVVYLQICNVEIFQESSSSMSDSSKSSNHKSGNSLSNGWKQHFAVNRFVMEQAFSKGSKSVYDAGIEDHHIKRTVFVTEKSFPHLLKRIKIVSKTESELSPIECSISAIEKKTKSLRSEMSSTPTNIRNIQRELQGAVLTQVNAGPIAIIQTFLPDSQASKFPLNLREELADKILEFERSIGFALRLNKAFVDETIDHQVTLQEELEKGTRKLQQSIASTSIFAIRKDARQQQDEEARKLEVERAHKTLADDMDTLRPKKSPSSSVTNLATSPVSAGENSTIQPHLSSSNSNNNNNNTITTTTNRNTTSNTSSSGRSTPSRSVTEIHRPSNIINNSSSTKSPLGRSPSAIVDNSKSSLLPPIEIPSIITPPIADNNSTSPTRKESSKSPRDKNDVPKKSTRSSSVSDAKNNKTINNKSNLTSSALNASNSPNTVVSSSSNPSSKTSPAPSLNLPPSNSSSNTNNLSPRIAGESSTTPPASPSSSSSSTTPRGRTASVNAQQKSAIDREKEREAREKEREAELREKAKQKELARRTVNMDDPNLKAEMEKSDKNLTRSNIVDACDVVSSKMTIMSKAIPIAMEAQELSPLVKNIKQIKERINNLLPDLGSSVSAPLLKPNPASDGVDKFTYFKNVCLNEISNIKISINHISKHVGSVDQLETLKQIHDKLTELTSFVENC